MKVSKVVIIVVALHVLVIGGIFIFEGCTRAKSPAPDFAVNESTPSTNGTAMSGTETDPLATGGTPAGPTAGTLTPIPTSTVTPTVLPTPAPVAKTYVVKKGDTLWKIAKSQHVSIGELSRANNLTKNSALKVNQKLTVPVKAEPAAVSMAAPAPVSATPMDSTTPVAPSAAPVSGNTYTVKTGDSLWKIAKAEHVSVTAIKQANNLTSDSLKVNQKLTIPAATATTPAPVATLPPPAPGVPSTATTAPQASVSTASNGEWQPGGHVENGQTFHTVDINESPSAIAKKYGVKVEDLLKANKLDATKRIVVGQKLVIPAANSPVSSATPAITTPIVTSSN